MAEKMRRIAACSGEIHVEGPLQKEYENWYEAMKRRFASHLNPALAEPFANRHRVHVLKLWAIFELSSSASLTLSKESFERAVEMARQIEETIFALLKTGFSAEGARSCDLEELIRKAGPSGFSQTDVYNANRGSRGFDVKDRMTTLLGAEIVTCFRRKPSGPGRPGLFFVHRDHLEQHAKDFPQDESAGKS